MFGRGFFSPSSEGSSTDTAMKKDLQRKHTQNCLVGKHSVFEKKVYRLEATIIEEQDKKANVVLQLGDTVAELRLIQAESAEQKETIAALQNEIALQQAESTEQKETIAALQNEIAMQQAVLTAQVAVMQSKVAASQMSAACDELQKKCSMFNAQCSMHNAQCSMLMSARA